MESLLQELNTPWVRDVGILLAAALVALVPARLVTNALRQKRHEDEPRDLRVLRNALEVVVWPVLAMGLFVLGCRIYARFNPEASTEAFRVLPLLLFLMAYRVLNVLALEFVPRGDRRRQVRRLFIPSFFVLAAAEQLDFLGPFIEWMRQPLWPMGRVPVSLFSIASALGVLVLFVVGGRLLARFVGSKFLPGVGIELSLAEAIGTVLRYLLVVLGIVVSLDTMGFDLTTVKIAFGALGVGIGFGLQNVVNNFTSGLILLFERSVKKGDVLTVAGTDGRVMSVGLRSSIIRTRGGDDIIVPNSDLVSNQVTNYSFRDRLKRVDVDVGVSYESEPRKIEEILLKVAEENPRILRHPRPTVLFMDFGDSSLDFQLRAWIDDAWFLPRVRSELYFSIWDGLKEEGVQIPFPQRDLHVRSGELQLRQAEST